MISFKIVVKSSLGQGLEAKGLTLTVVTKAKNLGQVLLAIGNIELDR